MKFTETVKNIILDNIEQGLTQSDCAALAGIHYNTLTQWLKDNSDFREEVEKRRIAFKKRNINLVSKAANRQWQAAAWFLERKYADEYALKQTKDPGVNIFNSQVIVAWKGEGNKFASQEPKQLTEQADSQEVSL